MKEAMRPLVPLDIPKEARDAADAFLSSDLELLQTLWDAPTAVVARKSVEPFIPRAVRTLHKKGVPADIAKRAFIDAAIGCWAELHPAEKIPE